MRVTAFISAITLCVGVYTDSSEFVVLMKVVRERKTLSTTERNDVCCATTRANLTHSRNTTNNNVQHNVIHGLLSVDYLT